MVIGFIWMLYAGLMLMYVAQADSHPFLSTMAVVAFVGGDIAMLLGATLSFDGSARRIARALVIVGCAVLTAFAAQFVVSAARWKEQLPFAVLVFFMAMLSDLAGCKAVRGRPQI
jgi:hypothetical protein